MHSWPVAGSAALDVKQDLSAMVVNVALRLRGGSVSVAFMGEGAPALRPRRAVRGAPRLRLFTAERLGPSEKRLGNSISCYEFMRRYWESPSERSGFGR